MPRLGSSVPPSNSIESSQIQDGAIVGADLALASVSGNAIAAGALVHEVAHNGTLVGTRKQINLIPGSNVTLTVTDNPGSDRVDVTVAAADGGAAESFDYFRKSASVSAVGAVVGSNPPAPKSVGFQTDAVALSPGSAQGQIDADGTWYLPATGGGVGDACGWRASSTAIPSNSFTLLAAPVASIRFSTGNLISATDIRSGLTYFGLFSGLPTTVDNLALAGIHGFGFRHKHPGSLNFHAVCCDGVTEVDQDTGWILTSGLAYNLKIDATGVLSGVKFYINGTQVAEITSGLPGNTRPLAINATTKSLQAALHRIALSKFDVQFS